MDRSIIPSPAHAAGDVVHGFKIEAVTPLEDIKALAYEATHQQTGARVLHIHCHDEENMFSIGFRTPPADSTGVAHILEHSVLAGSKKYPVKDAFTELRKRTLSTFLNAMTWPDRTVYPTCSAVRADYFNLAAVYADLVFNPRLERQTFEQEGHHLELEDLDDVDSPLKVSGVVYNEMKGVYSSPESYVYRQMQQELLPDTIYGNDSGGDPEVIPELTYEQFKAFHERYYAPTNARFLLYGEIPLADNLAFIEQVLAPFARVEVDSSIPLQPRWSAPRERAFAYPVGEEDSLERKSFVTMSWLVNDTVDVLESLLLGVAMSAVYGSAASPLRKALVDSQLGEALFPEGGYDDDIQQASVSVGLRGTEREHAEAIERLVLETLEKVVEEGVDDELIEASFHRIEMAGKEIVPPFPLMLLYRTNPPWYFGGDPKAGLSFSSMVEQARARYAADPGLFNGLIKRWLVDNPHRLRLTVYPSNTLAEEQEAAHREAMAARKAKLSAEAISAIQREAQALKAAQDEPDSPEALATLPKLATEDIPRELRVIPCEPRAYHGVAGYEYPVFSNGIGYVGLAFDISDLDDELAMMLPMLGKATLKMGAAGLDYEQMARRIARHTGGFGASPAAGRRLDDDARFEHLFVSGKTLARESEATFEILRDLLVAPDPSDHKRLRDLVLESASKAGAALVPRGHSFAYLRASAGLDHTLWRREQWQGVSQVLHLKQAAEVARTQPAQLAERLAALQARLFTRARVQIDVAGDPEVLDAMRPHLEAFVAALPEGSAPTPAAESTPRFGREAGVIIPARVNYVGQVLRAPRTNSPDAPAFEMLAQVVADEFLYKKLRVQGGAYGGFSFYAGESGLMALLSYRDPNLLRTLDVYKQVVDFVRSDSFNDEMIEGCRVGVLGNFNRVLSPAQKLSVARSRRMSALDDETRRAYRDGLFAIDAETIRRRALPQLEAALADAPRAVLAARQALEEANVALDGALELVSIE